jgi:hypothetical protein
MKVEDHLDLEKVSKRESEKLLKIARLQGSWTSAKSLLHQAEALGVTGPIMQQFTVHIERIESQLAELGAVKPEQPHAK